MCLDDAGWRYAEPDPAETWPKSKRKVPGVSPFSTHICHVSASLPALSATGMVPIGVRVGCRRGKTTHLSFHAVETSFASREKLLLGPPINKPCQETVLFIHTKSTHYNEAPQCFAVLSLPTCPISQRLGLPDRPIRNKCKKRKTCVEAGLQVCWLSPLPRRQCVRLTTNFGEVAGRPVPNFQGLSLGFQQRGFEPVACGEKSVGPGKIRSSNPALVQ